MKITKEFYIHKTQIFINLHVENKPTESIYTLSVQQIFVEKIFL